MLVEVRSNELDTGLSYSDKVVEVDTAVSAPSSLNPSSSSNSMLRAFHTLKEVCSLDEDILLGLGIGSNSLKRLGFFFPVQGKTSRRYVSMKLPS